jgi:hypothetical protein
MAQGIASGTYIGTWDGISPDPALMLQKIVTGFRPKTVQILARVTTGPDTGLNISKVDSPVFMPDGTVFIFTATGFSLLPDPIPGIGTITIEDDGFVVGLFANLVPGVSQAGPPALPDFYAYLVTG